MPGLEGVTPAVTVRGIANPSSVTTVLKRKDTNLLITPATSIETSAYKVEIFIGSMYDSETLFNDSSNLVECIPDPVINAKLNS